MAEERKWAIVLGASSGFGEASALELARHGYDIAGVHLDRRSTLPNVERIAGQVRDFGREALFFNMNAADGETRRHVCEALQERIRDEGGSVRVLLHSLAFGTLRFLVGEQRDEAISQAQMEMTLDVMAHSLVYWAQDLVHGGLMGQGGRIMALTSAGSFHVWPCYGAVGAAKAALESHVRHLAVELGKRGIAVNALRAGVTETPALKKIPGHELLVEYARHQNPCGRVTVPFDVAQAVVMLARFESSWITGNVIGVDGGEFLVT